MEAWDTGSMKVACEQDAPLMRSLLEAVVAYRKLATVTLEVFSTPMVRMLKGPGVEAIGAALAACRLADPEAR